jgi:hypothetical protein
MSLLVLICIIYFHPPTKQMVYFDESFGSVSGFTERKEERENKEEGDKDGIFCPRKFDLLTSSLSLPHPKRF